MNEQDLRRLGVGELLEVLAAQVKMALEIQGHMIHSQSMVPDMLSDGPLITIGDFDIYPRKQFARNIYELMRDQHSPQNQPKQDKMK